MTLHHSILLILKEKQCELSVYEIANELNLRKTWVRKDGKDITFRQIRTKVLGYPQYFTINGDKIRISDEKCEDITLSNTSYNNKIEENFRKNEKVQKKIKGKYSYGNKFNIKEELFLHLNENYQIKKPLKISELIFPSIFSFIPTYLLVGVFTFFSSKFIDLFFFSGFFIWAEQYKIIVIVILSIIISLLLGYYISHIEKIERSVLPPDFYISPYSNNDDTIRCPKCFSSQISANRRGFNPGKALVGGIVGGFIGSSKVKITCLKCGKTWMAGEIK